MPTSSVVKNKYTTIDFESNKEHIKYKLDVPQGFIDYSYVRGGNEYWWYCLYSDSSCVYITDMKSTRINGWNIKMLGDSIYDFRFQDNDFKKAMNDLLAEYGLYEYMNKQLWPDTLELSGKDEDSLYWKDIKIGEVSVGYAKVTRKNKKMFDKSLTTLRIVK